MKEVHGEKYIKDTYTLSHDHSYTSLNLNSSETMISKGNETLCGLYLIPTVVMAGSHYSIVHLDSEILNGDHVTLYSLAHYDTSKKGEEDLNDKREIKLSPQEVAS